MSKASRERKRLARLARETNSQPGQQTQPIQSQLPIVGNFEQRATEIIRRDNQMNGNGSGNGKADDHKPNYIGYTQPPRYDGYPGGHFVSNGPVKDIGYRPINHEKDKKVFNVVSSDITTGECPIAKIPKVYVTTRLWNEWIALAEDYTTEWLAYLTGQFVKDDKGSRYEIQKMYFPPQVAHATHVDVDDDFEGYLANTIGAIHSHVQMGVFFSMEDLAHSNWPIEIVVNAKGEAKVMVRHQLDCGAWIKNYSDILTVGDSAGEKYIASLDKAFKRGEELRQARVKKTVDSVGYRTPDVNVSITKVGSGESSYTGASYIEEEDWKFRINGVPHGWRQVGKDPEDGEWVRMVKVNGKWLYCDDPIIGSSQVTIEDATGDSRDTAAVIIDAETGKISSTIPDDGSTLTGERPVTQEEIDRVMEAEVDDNSCPDCDGTGKITPQVNCGYQIECTACGGLGWIM